MTSTSFFDAPGGIRKEGNSQTLTFTRLTPTSGTVCWTPTPPTPAGGCGTPNHYVGGLLIGSTSPIEQPNKPSDGVCCYKADPTFDPLAFAGDKIDDANVLWTSNVDMKTGCVTVNGLDGNCTAYYFAFFAMDNVCRYNQDGIYSYSLNHGGPAIPCVSGKQTILTGGIKLTDPIPVTIDKTINYPIKVAIDGKLVDLVIRGDKITTYKSVIDELESAWKYVVPPIVSPYSPLYGKFYTDGTSWYQNDGAQYKQISPILQLTDPAVVSDGEVWVDSTATIRERIAGAWVPIPTVIVLNQDPTIVSIGQHWYNGTVTRRYDGYVWIDVVKYMQSTDPTLPPVISPLAVWKKELEFSKWNVSRNKWTITTVLSLPYSFAALSTVDTRWFNPIDAVLRKWTGIDWLPETATISTTEPVIPNAGEIWVHPTTKVTQQYSTATLTWTVLQVIVYYKSPTDPSAGEMYFDQSISKLYTYDGIAHTWIDITGQLLISPYDPSIAPVVVDGTLWYKTSSAIWFVRKGTSWVGIQVTQVPTDPRTLSTGVWYNSVTHTWYERNGTTWTLLAPRISATDPTTPVLGTTWYDGTTLHQRTTIATWTVVLFDTVKGQVPLGTRWLNDLGELRGWSGTAWILIKPPYTIAVTENDNIVVTSGTCGSESYVEFISAALLTDLRFVLCKPLMGNDGTSGIPMYDDLGIGTDGSVDERRKIIDNLYMRLGFPSITVELNRDQMDLAVQKGLDYIRRDSGAGYNRGYFFLDLQPDQQQYVLTSKKVGFNKIVDILYLYRPRGGFLNSTFGGEIYGQQLLQQLYVSGTFDILSYHLLASYQTVVAKLFASELQFSWTERSRVLSIMRKIPRVERILVDAVIERTEQDLFTDRMTKTWIENWALSEAKIMLGDMRGKFGSLPGAGGNITLNADVLKADANTMQEKLLKEIDDYNASDIETWGLGSSISKG